MFWSGVLPLIAGLALLVVAADLTLRGAARLALSLGVRPFIIGLTVVSVATSLPELAVGITAADQGLGGLVVGNIAGSNIVNILLILGLSAAIRPLALHLQILKLDLPVLLGAVGLITSLAWDGSLWRLDGGILLAAAVLYTAALVLAARRERRSVKEQFAEVFGPGEFGAKKRVLSWRTRLLDLVILAIGIGLSIFGADVLVGGASVVAGALGVSDAVIGLTIVAIGTSAPELATTIVATLKNDRDVAVGNLLGSSIFNILVILAIPSIVSPAPLSVERDLLWFDIPLMGGVALLCLPTFLTGRRVSRGEGALFVSLYVAYISWMLLTRT